MSDFNPDVMYQKMVVAGEDWADKKAAYEALDGATKSVLADISFQCQFPPTNGVPGEFVAVKELSYAAAERNALTTERWKNHLVKVAAAHKAYLHAKVQYKAIVALAEWRRSQEATRRAEARIV